MGGNFTVTPAHLHDASQSLTNDVAPAYAQAATAIQTGAHIEAPGFGLLLSWVEAMYVQRVDYVTKDLNGAHDVVNQIASRLEQTASEYQKGENLNISGFDGRPKDQQQHEQGFWSAYGQVASADATGAAPLALISVDAMYGALVAMGACSALCPAFIPAVIVAATVVANVPSMWDAHTVLVNQGNHISGDINAWFDNACGQALDGWDGEGKLNFTDMKTKIESHLGQLAGFVGALGTALVSLIFVLTGFWGAIIASVFPFLAWLVAMTISEVFPPDIPVIESIKEAAGAAMAEGINMTVVAIASVAGMVAGLINTVLEKGADLTLPDSGQAGVPDMQEFHVDQNYKTTI